MKANAKTMLPFIFTLLLDPTFFGRSAACVSDHIKVLPKFGKRSLEKIEHFLRMRILDSARFEVSAHRLNQCKTSCQPGCDWVTNGVQAVCSRRAIWKLQTFYCLKRMLSQGAILLELLSAALIEFLLQPTNRPSSCGNFSCYPEEKHQSLITCALNAIFSFASRDLHCSMARISCRDGSFVCHLSKAKRHEAQEERRKNRDDGHHCCYCIPPHHAVVDAQRAATKNSIKPSHSSIPLWIQRHSAMARNQEACRA